MLFSFLGQYLPLSNFRYIVTALFIYNSHTIHSPISLGCSIFTELCSYHHNQFWNILITPKRNLISMSSHSHFPATSGNHQSVCKDSPILNISHKRKHTICGPMWLAAFTWQNVFKVHTRSMNGSKYSIVWKYHILFIHSSPMDIWAVSTFLAFVNNAAANI